MNEAGVFSLTHLLQGFCNIVRQILFVSVHTQPTHTYHRTRLHFHATARARADVASAS